MSQLKNKTKVDEVWEKAKPVRGKNPKIVRKGDNGNLFDQIKPNFTRKEAKIKKHDADWLPDALEQLKYINQEAIEENYPEICSKSIALAENLLYKLCDFSIDPEVYPSMYGDVSIYFKSNSKPAAVLLRVVGDQCVVFHSSIDGENKERIYNGTAEIPDKFLEHQLQALL